MLREALQRVEGGHRASALLRKSVTAAMSSELQGFAGGSDQSGLESAGGVATRSRSFWSRPAVWAAAAACVLLGLGVAAKLSWDAHLRSQAESFVVANQEFLDLAIRTFNASEPRLTQTFPVNLPPAEIARRMSAVLGHQITIPDGSATGWTVTTAGVTDLGFGPVAYVYFRNQTRSAAMLVFPPQQSLSSGAKFDVRLSGHRVGGVATPAGLHTFVTRPCEEGATDDLSDLVDLVARNSFLPQ